MGKLTTHVLDVVSGKPAAGVGISLSREGEFIARLVTTEDGRCDRPLVEGELLETGTYELVFEVGAYFAARGILSSFLDKVPVVFRMEAGGSYHVPLVCSPWSYSTYRGS